MDLKKTPLYEKHEALGAKFAPFGGWLMPISYTGIIDEHTWTRENASLFDICHMGEFRVKGKGAAANLNKIVTIDTEKMPLAACRYGFILNNEGFIKDDLLVYRLTEDEFMIVVNAATTDSDKEHFTANLDEGIVFEDASRAVAKIDLQGPLSRQLLSEMIAPEVSELKYYRFGLFSLLGEEVIVSRTGYTGELGYEIYISADKAAELWDTLLTLKQVKPAGLGARDTLRLEMGYPLYGQDIDDKTTPFEAGLESFVDMAKDFKGKDALVKEQAKGSGKKLICFKTESRRSPRHNYKIFSGDKEIGLVTSGSFSPSLGYGIGMGYAAKEFTALDKEIILKGSGVEIKASTVKRPFYGGGSLKA